MVYKKRKGQPKLTKLHKKNRLNFATEKIEWYQEWDQIIFSDEKNSIWTVLMGFNSTGAISGRRNKFIRNAKMEVVMLWSGVPFAAIESLNWPFCKESKGRKITFKP